MSFIVRFSYKHIIMVFILSPILSCLLLLNHLCMCVFLCVGVCVSESRCCLWNPDPLELDLHVVVVLETKLRSSTRGLCALNCKPFLQLLLIPFLQFIHLSVFQTLVG